MLGHWKKDKMSPSLELLSEYYNNSFRKDEIAVISRAPAINQMLTGTGSLVSFSEDDMLPFFLRSLNILWLANDTSIKQAAYFLNKEDHWIDSHLTDNRFLKCCGWKNKTAKYQVYRKKCTGKITLIQHTPVRWRENKYFGDSYFLSGSYWGQTAQISCKTGRVSQSALKTDNPLQFELCKRWPGLKNVSKNITAGGQYNWWQNPVDHSNNLYHQTVKDKKNNQNDEKDHWHHGCCHRCCIKSPAVKSST